MDDRVLHRDLFGQLDTAGRGQAAVANVDLVQQHACRLGLAAGQQAIRLLQLAGQVPADACSAFGELAGIGLRRLVQQIQRVIQRPGCDHLMARPRRRHDIQVEDAPLAQRLLAAGIHVEMVLVILAGEKDQLRGVLKLPEQRRWRQRQLCTADRIAAGQQQGAMEQVRIAQRDALGHPRTTGKPADIDAPRIHRILPHDVVDRQQGQRYAAVEHIGIVAGIRGADVDHAVAIQRR